MASTLASDERTETGEYRILVAVGNPSNARQLTRTAADVARANGGSVHVVSVIHKPYTSPFLLFSDERIKEEFAGDRRRIVDRAAAVAADVDVPVEDSLLVGSDVSEAILEAIDRTNADAALLGWQGRRDASDVVLGTTIDSVLFRADCDVLVEKVGRTADAVDSVLLPTIGGPHAALAADVAEAIATANDASINAASIVAPDADDRERAAARDHVDETAEMIADAPVERSVEEGRDVADALLERTGEHDLIVLGATRKGRLTRRVVGTVPQKLGRRAECPVIVTKRRPGERRIARLVTRWWSRG